MLISAISASATTASTSSATSPCGDTDEFDQSVIAHEFGHYLEDRFARSDSIGGDHGGSTTLLDLRVAFGEGWGNAFSGMVLGGPIYRDSFGRHAVGLQHRHGSGRFAATKAGSPRPRSARSCGTCSMRPHEAGDTLSLGFAPLYAVMTGAQTTTDAVTSIFSFITALRAANPGSLAAIDTLVTGEDISGTGDVRGRRNERRR